MTLPSTTILTSNSQEAATQAKSGGCGCDSKSSATVEMDEKLKERIAKHPCYSEDAHHHYARMHVAVAAKTLITTTPGCTLQLRQPVTFNATIATGNMTARTKAVLE